MQALEAVGCPTQCTVLAVQGSSNSVKRVKSSEWAAEHSTEMIKFVNEKWGDRPSDVGRKWQANVDEVTADLVPGFMLQHPAPTSFIEEENKYEMFEFKTARALRGG